MNKDYIYICRNLQQKDWFDTNYRYVEGITRRFNDISGLPLLNKYLDNGHIVYFYKNYEFGDWGLLENIKYTDNVNKKQIEISSLIRRKKIQSIL